MDSFWGDSIKPTAQSAEKTSPVSSATSVFWGKTIQAPVIPPKAAPVSQPSPYYATTTPAGYSLGPSKEVDPYSGRPLLDYRNPGDTSTTTDRTRTDPLFDPIDPALHTKEEVDNPRMPQSASQKIRSDQGATSEEQLDHRMALALGGANTPENLKLIPKDQNQAAGKSEQELNQEVKDGKISLFEAQIQEAKNKGLNLPFTAGVDAPAPANNSGFWGATRGGIDSFFSKKTPQGGYDQPSLSRTLNETASKAYSDLGDATLYATEHPKEAVNNASLGAHEVIQSAAENVLNFAQGFDSFATDIGNLFINSSLGPLVTKAVGHASDNGFNQEGFSHDVAPGMEGANLSGNIIGGALPYIFGGEAIKPLSVALENSSPLLRTLGHAVINTGLPAMVGMAQPLNPGESRLGRFFSDLPGNALFGITSMIPHQGLSALATGLSQLGVGAAKGQDASSNFMNAAILTIFGLAGAHNLNDTSPSPKMTSERAQEIINTPLTTNPDPKDVLLRNAAHEFLKQSPSDQKTFMDQAKALWAHIQSLPKNQGHINFGASMNPEEKPEQTDFWGDSIKPTSDVFRPVQKGETFEPGYKFKMNMATGENLTNAPTKPEIKPLSDSYEQVTRQDDIQVDPLSSLKEEARKYKSPEEFDSAIRQRIEPVIKLAGNEIEDIKIIGSTAEGKAKPNDTDILVSLKNKRSPTDSSNIHDRKEFNEVIEKEIKDLFPNRVHVTVADYDPARGKGISLKDFHTQATKEAKGQSVTHPTESINPKIIKEAANYASPEDYTASLEARKTSYENMLKRTPDDLAVKRAIEMIDTKIETAQKLPKEAFSASGEKVIKPIVRSDKAEEVYQKLHDLNLERSIIRDSVENNPVAELKKYIDRKTGQLPEVTGVNNPKLGEKANQFRVHGDDIVTELGLKNSDEAQKALDDHLLAEKRLEDLNARVADARRNLAALSKEDADAKSLNFFLKQSFKDQGTEINQAAREADALKEGYSPEIMKGNGGVVPPKVRGGIRSPELDFSKWKDKSLIRMNRDTFDRNIEKVAPPSDATAVKKFFVDPLRSNEMEKVKASNAARLEVREKMKEFGIKAGSVDDQLIQILGEGKTNLTYVLENAKNPSAVQKAIEYFRGKYDSLIDQWNEERAKFGYSPVPKREDYFRHFADIDFFTRTFGFLKNNKELPTSITGETPFFKPGKPFSTAELRRTGDKTSYSAIRGFDNYIESVNKQLYHIDTLQRGKALIKYLTDASKATEAEGKGLQLQNFKENLNNLVYQSIGGKQSTLDRGIEGLLGRSWIKKIGGLSNYIAKNIIVGNATAAMSHLVSLPLNFATVEKVPLAKGIMTTLTSPLKEEPFTKIDGNDSSFLIRRYPVNEINPRWWTKTEDILNFVMNTADKFKSTLAVSSKYYEGIGKGLSPEESMKQADDYAGRILGDYSIGNRPNLFNNKSLGSLMKFQLGMNDGLSVLLHDIPNADDATKLKTASKYVQFAVYSFLLNQMYKKIKGSGKGIDPIDWGLTLTGLNDEGRDKSIFDRLKLTAGDISGELPFINLFTGTFPLGQVITSAEKDVPAAISDAASGKWWQAASDLKNEAIDFASPVGGGVQINKTISGINALIKGEASAGKTTYKVPATPTNIIKSVIFGPSATAAGQTNRANSNTLYGMIDAENKSSKGSTKESEDFYNQMKVTAKTDPKKAIQDLRDLAAKDPAQAKKVLQAFQDESAGITGTDRLIKQLGVASGARAQYIVSALNQFKTPQEKISYLKSLSEKKIITNEVLAQIVARLKKK